MTTQIFDKLVNSEEARKEQGGVGPATKDKATMFSLWHPKIILSLNGYLLFIAIIIITRIDTKSRSKIGEKKIVVIVGLITKQVSKLPNWKSLEPNGLQRYFLQNDKSTRQKVAEFYNECLQKGTVPTWKTNNISHEG